MMICQIVSWRAETIPDKVKISRAINGVKKSAHCTLKIPRQVSLTDCPPITSYHSQIDQIDDDKSFESQTFYS